MASSTCVMVLMVLMGNLAVSWGHPDLPQVSPLYLLLNNGQQGNNDDCNNDLLRLRDAIDSASPWALRMLDSSGTPTHGFLWGNNYWLGSREQCLDIPNRKPLLLANNEVPGNNSWPPYDVRFTVATIRHNSTMQVHVGLPNEDLITLGLCVPATCTARAMKHRLKALLSGRPLLVQNLYQVDLLVHDVRTLEDDGMWILEDSVLVVVSLLLLFPALAVVGTLYDVVMWQPSLKKRARASPPSTHHCETLQSTEDDVSKPPHAAAVSDKDSGGDKQGVLGKFLLCFSVYTNTQNLLRTHLSTGCVRAIHGVRFMSMCWVLMVHTLYYIMDYVDNRPFAVRRSEAFLAQILSNSTLSVDTFFFLSGFLLAYTYYEAGAAHAHTLCGQLKEFLLLVIHRYLRLTPAYLSVMGMAVLNMRWYSHTSVMATMERADLTCPRYWWRNVLYINNLFVRDEMCLSWSWFLSNDMQFYVVSAFLLVLSTRCFVASATLLLSLLVSSSLVTGYMSYSYDYKPTLDEQYRLRGVLYDPPWARIGPHLVGVATGVLVQGLGGALLLPRVVTALAWLVASACNLTVLFALHAPTMTRVTSALYVALGRPGWGVGLAWLTVACCTGHAGYINTLLSFRPWAVLSRLTYCTYLINPLLMMSVYVSSDTAHHITFLSLFTYFMGYVSMSYVCGYVVTLLYETPCSRVSRWLLGRDVARGQHK